MIDKHTLEIKQDDEKTVYKDLQEIGDDLPDHSPRFVLLSYPLTLVNRTPCDGVLEHGLMRDTAFRTIVGTLCSALLSSCDMQRGIEDVVCGCKGAHEKHGRGWQGY